MRLWTIQHPSIAASLGSGEVVSANWVRADADFRRAYEWLVRQMRVRIGDPPSADAAPLWAWYTWEYPRFRPDLRARAHVQPGEPAVLLTLEVSESRVLLSDFERWHYVLNYFYFDEDWARGERIVADFEASGNSPYLNVPVVDPSIHAAIEQTWQAIFDISKSSSIQAVLWELRPEDVVEVKHFKGR